MKHLTSYNGEQFPLSGNEIFVTCTDKWLSGWGCATGKTHKHIFVCENFEDARRLKGKLLNPRSGMKYVNITYSAPYYPATRYTQSIEKYNNTLFNWL